MSFSACSLLVKLLDQTQNALQLLEIGQSHAHQREQVTWTRRGHHLDAQSLRLDALDHAKEEIRSHYDTYAGRIDTLLLTLALIWPFALALIQFSDPFVPDTELECPECVQGQWPWIIGIWVGLMGVVLILPFWGILMVIRCKIALDKWLEKCLRGLNQERRDFVIVPPARPSPTASHAWTWTTPLLRARGKTTDLPQDDEATDKMVNRIVNVVLQYQEDLARIWLSECGWLVHTSTMLLWMSVVAALLLTSISMWIFLANKGGAHAYYSTHFAVFIFGGGCVVPAIYIAHQKWVKRSACFENADAPEEFYSPLAWSSDSLAIAPTLARQRFLAMSSVKSQSSASSDAGTSASSSSETSLNRSGTTVCTSTSTSTRDGPRKSFSSWTVGLKGVTEHDGYVSA